MGQLENIKPCLGYLVLGLVLVCVPFAPLTAADDYLSIVEAEASDTGEKTPAATSPEQPVASSKKVKHVTAGKEIEPGLSFEDFEETLGSQYSGSNFLYVKLTDKKRKVVYRFYQGDNRISSVREEIVRLLSSS